MEPDENANNISEPPIECLNKVKETRGRKKWIGGPLEETFLTLWHTLYMYSDLIKHLLIKKGLNYVLTGRSNNDPIEKWFSLNRYLSSNHLTLDVSSFAHNERTLFINLLSRLCCNPNNSYNKEKYNNFFEDVQSMSELSNRAEVNSLKLKLQDLTNMSFNKKLTESILYNEIILHIAGFSLKKLFYKSYPHCNMCKNKLAYGYNISHKRKKSMPHNILFMNLRNKGDLV